MTDQVLSLAKKAASYKRGGNHLLKAIEEIEEVLTSLFGEYTQFRFIHKCVGYVANLANSNVGAYGPALCYAEQHGEGRARFKPMPSQWSDAGSGFYLHNDFHVWIDTATRSEIVRVATNLPDFLRSLADFLEEKGNINTKSAESISKIVENLRNAAEETK